MPIPDRIAAGVRAAAATTATTTLLAAGAVGSAFAADFNAIGLLTQSEFRAFGEDIAAAVSYKPMIPSEGLGVTGFDFGVAVAATGIAHRDVLRKAARGASVPASLPQFSLRAVKGLPFDIDVGAVVAALPGTNVRATGGELRWAFVGGGVVLPAVALRVSMMNLSGVDQLELDTQGVDLSISKGFANLTPYAGIGRVSVRASAPGTGLAREKFGLDKAFIGLNVALVPFALAVEADRTGDTTGVGVKLAVRW